MSAQARIWAAFEAYARAQAAMREGGSQSAEVYALRQDVNAIIEEELQKAAGAVLKTSDATRHQALRAAIASWEKTGKVFCFRCGSSNVALSFAGYAPAHDTGTGKDVELPQVGCVCRSCGNAWTDGSGDYVEAPS